MAFESLADKLQSVFKILRGKGRLTERDVRDAMREVRLALLEADVNYKIVKEFVASVTEKAVGANVLESLSPGQQVIKIVNDELTSLMGASNSRLTFASKPPTVYLLAGLQGAGKTTASGKLAGLLRKQGKKPLLVACDVYRPAAIKQLQVVGGNYNLPVFEMGQADPVAIAQAGVALAVKNSYDVVLLDTAGRLHIDQELMEELTRMKAAVHPQEILLVVDAMTGQDAVTAVESFNNTLGVDGVILTKMDSDARGGAALSVRKVTGKPIKFVGMGEKIDDLEPFYPDRMASRILGMGDILSLIDKAEQALDKQKAIELERKMRQNEFSLDDFLEQMQQMKKMGPIKNILGMLPGLGRMNLDEVDVDEKSVARTEAIITSMTREERRNPAILNSSRKRRIAAGCGQPIQEVNRLLKQFEEIKKLMKGLTGPGKGKRGMFNMPFMK